MNSLFDTYEEEEPDPYEEDESEIAEIAKEEANLKLPDVPSDDTDVDLDFQSDSDDLDFDPPELPEGDD
jgi:hypothetical protein